MSVDLTKLMRALACSLLAIGLALGTGIGSALTAEQQPSVDQIIQALKPKPLTRSLDSLTAPPSESTQNPAESQFIDSLRNSATRSITLNEREKIATIAQDKRGIDFEINFEYNSAKIAPSAMPTARNLGEALTGADLKGSTFIIEGHTDAKGSDLSNQKLSERRADTIKRFLVNQYKVPAAELVAVGYGKSRLKNPNDPFGAENRRVRVVNMAANMANK
jgi:outer membrane protein OmpA-like peptidoglycan-associated protein